LNEMAKDNRYNSSEKADRKAIEDFHEQNGADKYRTVWGCKGCGAQYPDYPGCCKKCGCCAFELAVPKEGLKQ